jgi:hypothetical protein
MEKTMAEFVYICGAVTSTVCALLLSKSYFERRSRLLLWVAVSFGFLALNNVFACVDLIILPGLDLWGSVVRNGLFATAGFVLVAGLAWELS